MTGIAAVLLAAGTSSRYRRLDPGVASKLVATTGGVPLVRHVALAAVTSRAEPVVVVTGHAATEVATALAGLDVTLVHNPDFAAGLSTSLRRGLAALPSDVAGALILLGDMPGVSADLIDRLIAACDQNPAFDAVVPVHDGQRGNPALLTRRLFAAARGLEGDAGARRLFDKASVLEVDWADSSVVIDIDDPAALRAFDRARHDDAPM